MSCTLNGVQNGLHNKFNFAFFALELADEDLGDEDVLALESISEISMISEEGGGEGETNLQITLIITLKDAMLSLSRVFKIIEVRTNIKI